MLDSLDTLIAFVLIMLVVSLLITIVVQMVSAALNLRGLNMLSGLAQVFQVIAPAEEKRAGALARQVLSGGMLSDSSLPKWRMLGLWRWASAARPQEVFDSIHRIATGQKETGGELQQTAQSLLTALGVEQPVLTAAAGRIQQAGNMASELTKAVQSVPDAAVRGRIEQHLQGLTAQLDSYANAEAARIAAGAVTIDHAYERFQYWYEIAQERVGQWFTTHTRFLTVILALVFACWLQLDTVEIFSLVSSNRAMRNQLVSQSGVVAAQTEKVLSNSPVSAGTAKPGARDYNAIKMDFDRDGFDLFPRNPGGRWGNGWRQGWTDHWVGIVFSIGLLSLGAPFWYNVLKGLTSLRSNVAENIASDKKQAPGALARSVLPTAPAPVRAPPTVR